MESKEGEIPWNDNDIQKCFAISMNHGLAGHDPWWCTPTVIRGDPCPCLYRYRCRTLVEVDISLNCVSELITVQLEQQGYTLPKSDAERFQDLVHAINMIQAHGLVSDTVCHDARKRLVKDIIRCVKPIPSGNDD